MATTVVEGAEELLAEVVCALSSSASDYIVIGGWCPYLRNTAAIEHPGTADVDLLFRNGGFENALAPAVEALLNNGFIASAKHPFQLLREKVVGSKNLIYNVDLLHPNMEDDKFRLFVDQLDLDIPLNSNGRRVKKMQSIVQPNSAVLFEEHLYSCFNFKNTHFELVDFTGMFITKMDSCQKIKRERDAFDIYIGFECGMIDCVKLQQIASKYERVAESLKQFGSFLRSDGAVFDHNVRTFGSPTETSPAKHILAILGDCTESVSMGTGQI